MGFLDKMKNLFTEEVEETEVKPVKKENRVVEPALPRRETVVKRETELPLTESKVEENKDKFVFPVYFDDKDFDDLEKPKEKAKPLPPKEPKNEPYQGAKVKIEQEPKRVFKPSPIISPVYGVLDKNYSRDDITTKKPTAQTLRRHSESSHPTVDDVRNKAYGTLEDDLESTLLEDVVVEEPHHRVDNEGAIDIFNELNFDKLEEENNKNKSFDKLEESILLGRESSDADTAALARQLEEQKQKLEEINQYMSENEIIAEHNSDDTIEDDEVEALDNELPQDRDIEPESDSELMEEELHNHENQPTTDTNLNDSELFDLIDSMYEKRDEE